MENILTIVDLQKRFELHILNEKVIEALHQVSLEVAEGEIVALTGKSGSGKSSLMKCIYRTYLASGGQILYRDAQGRVLDLATASDYEVLRIRKTCGTRIRPPSRVASSSASTSLAP
jgi:alpha-D-ribose 1-methylphosphonate 5-triphosphate synthase subunit PhnL